MSHITFKSGTGVRHSGIISYLYTKKQTRQIDVGDKKGRSETLFRLVK